MEEEWKSIPGLKGYEVSNQGRVRSWWRSGPKGSGMGKGCGPRVIGDTFKYQTQHIDSDGYFITSVTGDDGIHRSVKVHRLVATAFIPNPESKLQINHKNEIKTDNRVENLEWCDAKYNLTYGTRIERVTSPKRKPVSRYDLQGKYIDTFVSSAEASRKTGICHISSACTGSRPFAGGYQWRYSEDTSDIAPYVKTPHASKRCRRVSCFSTDGVYIKTYDSLTEAAKDTGARISDISVAVHGKKPRAHGYVWRLETESRDICNTERRESNKDS